MSAFKSYDIRGVYNKDFDKNTVYKIGFFLPELLNTNKILIGRDVRVSSPEICASLCRGITDAGADVYDIGLSTTPLIYWTTAKYNFDASVMITASHNPREYNGLKVSTTLAAPVGYDSGLKIIEQWIAERPIIPVENKGKINTMNVDEAYLDFQKQWLTNFDNLKIVIDCSNGMSSLFARKLYGNNADYIFDTMDGTFPNHEPNPLEPENIVALQKTVLEKHADIGVIFDGDADRVMFVDEKGKFISPDLMIGVLGHYFLKDKGLTGYVLQDIRSSKAIAEYIEPFDGKIYTWKVGRANAAVKLREIDGIYGGELAGHYYFRDFYYSDSAFMACSILLGIFSKMKQQGESVSQVISKLTTYANSGEINFKIDKKQEAMDAVRDYFTGKEQHIAYYDFDGYRIEFADWWLNIRPSNTEPYLRFIAEAKSREKLDDVVAKSKDIIEEWKTL